MTPRFNRLELVNPHSGTLSRTSLNSRVVKKQLQVPPTIAHSEYLHQISVDVVDGAVTDGAGLHVKTVPHT